MTNNLNIPLSVRYGSAVRQSNETANTSRLLALHTTLSHLQSHLIYYNFEVYIEFW